MYAQVTPGKFRNLLKCCQISFCASCTFSVQGLLDRQEFLQWILETVEKSRDPECPMFRMLMPVLLR